jgi:hypothetical protein
MKHMAAEQTATMTDVIVWASPIAFGFIVWLTHELYKGLKEDVSDVKKSNSNIRTDIAKQGVKIESLDQKITTVCASVETLKHMTHKLDKEQVGKPELELTMQAVKQIESRMNDSDKKYGTILMILNGMAKRIGIDIKKTGSN